MTRSAFERISLRLGRKMQVSPSGNLEENKDQPLSPAESSKDNTNSNTTEQNSNLKNPAPVEIKHVVKDVMNNSVAQAMLKLFHTPYIELKLLLALFVLITISTR
jgi:hypothetical protein